MGSVKRRKLECAQVALVLGIWRWLCLCQTMGNLWRKGRMVQERHLCSQMGQAETVQCESCFCYSVIPIKLWINQQVLRSRGGQPPNLSSYICLLSHILLWSVSGSNFVCSCHGKTSLLSCKSSLTLTLSEKVGRSLFVWPCLSVRARLKGQI